MYRLLTSIALLSAFLLPLHEVAWADVPSASRVEFRDQLGRIDSVERHQGGVVVAMVVTARRLRNLRGWQKELQERFEDIAFVLIADIPDDREVTYEDVVKKLGRRVPEEVSVLIDLERLWATELELDTSVPNVLVFDPAGNLIDRVRGRKDAELVDEVSRVVEALSGS